MNFDALKYRYPSRRMVVLGNNGMVATSQALAAQAGLDILKKGGNAIDAAIATAACLTVVEPTSNGVGGDAFAIVWEKDKIYGLNCSGFAPQGLSIDKLKDKGHRKMPIYGFEPITVPGIPYAWRELSKRFGKLELKDVFKPAINYAIEGFPVSPVVSKNWGKGFEKYLSELKGEEFDSFFKTFTRDGQTPKPGEIWKNEDLGNTLLELAETDCLSFYEGDIGEKIDKFSKKFDGYIRKKDLLEYKAEWVEPISINYRGYDVWELPPNTHGLVVLMALNILNNFQLSYEDSLSYHVIVEAMKLAYVDGLKYITDANKMEIPIEKFLSKEYGSERAKLITKDAIHPHYGNPDLGGTVYLAAADGEGNMISYIQSNYMGFGSGLVVPGTGISLHNRGCTFSLNPNDANCLEPGKKTYHTIIPGFLGKDKEAIGPFGVMGAYMQPQGHVQVVTNLIDFNHNPQEALDRPRWQWIEDKKVLVEPDFPLNIKEELIKFGHEVEYSDDVGSFGRGQIILKNGRTLMGGTEPRADGIVAPW